MRLCNVFIYAFMFLLSTNAIAGTAAAKLAKLSNFLISDYSTKVASGKAPLAIFPFNCDKELERRKVGFAVSEMMSHRFVSSPAFTVVERVELDKLLSEQKLQASGAVESETAVKLGKIVGAKVILVGNVQKVGGKYQVNSRLVNAETAEVISSGYEELDADIFEDDAKVYLNIVPEMETVGVSLLYHSGIGSSSARVYQIPDPGTITPAKFSPSGGGVRLSYKPHKNIQISAAMVSLGTKRIATAVDYSVCTFYYNHRMGGQLLELDLDYISKIPNSAFSYFAGLGGTIPRLTFVGYAISEEKNVDSFVPAITAGLSYRVQGRLTFSIRLRQDLEQLSVKNQYGNTVVKFPSLSLEPAVSLYF